MKKKEKRKRSRTQTLLVVPRVTICGFSICYDWVCTVSKEQLGTVLQAFQVIKSKKISILRDLSQRGIYTSTEDIFRIFLKCNWRNQSHNVKQNIYWWRITFAKNVFDFLQSWLFCNRNWKYTISPPSWNIRLPSPLAVKVQVSEKGSPNKELSRGGSIHSYLSRANSCRYWPSPFFSQETALNIVSLSKTVTQHIACISFDFEQGIGMFKISIWWLDTTTLFAGHSTMTLHKQGWISLMILSIRVLNR